MQYSETQRFRKWLIMLVMLIIIMVAYLYKTIVGLNELRLSTLIVQLISLTVVLWFLLWIKLTLRISDDTILISFFPFMSKTIVKAEIQTITVQQYKPLQQFGGWGLRYNWTFKHRAYSIRGNKALVIMLKNGKKIYVGTQQHEQLKQFTEKWFI